MAVNKQKYQEIIQRLNGRATLVAVSKMRTVEEILELYGLGQRDFGENYVQELFYKQERLPQDINWHFIGHLQSNKVKYLAPFIHLIHGVDSEKLLKEIHKQGLKINRPIPCLLQVHISAEETKFGFDAAALEVLMNKLKNDQTELDHAPVQGLMGMASFTEDNDLIKKEFNDLKSLFDKFKIHPAPGGTKFKILSMGMSADFTFALDAGSNMVRIGSLLFGQRNYNQ